MKSIDINCDMGETYHQRVVGNDAAVMPFISSCNIACGFHGGDPLTIENTIKTALKYNVKIGAHPSYPDIEGFGRRQINIPSDELFALVKYQISALKGMTEALGGKLHHVKPHGALYNAASQDLAIASIITDAAFAVDPTVFMYGAAGNVPWKSIVKKAGLRFIAEAFADRNYLDDLMLVPRKEKGALITNIDQSLDHVIRILKDKKVITINGAEVDIEAETICIHGDEENSSSLAQNLHQCLKEKGFTIAAPEI